MLLARLSSANCLQAFLWASFRRGFLLGWQPCKPTCCSVRRMVWALTSWPSTSATSKKCWQHSCICFLKPASAPDAQHKDSTSLIDPCEACSEWNPSWKTSVWPWPLYCNSVPGCYRTSYSLGHLCGEQQFQFSNPQRVLCHEVPCWTSSGQYERIVLKEPNFNCSKTRYTNLCGPVKQTKTWTWWIGHVALHG